MDPLTLHLTTLQTLLHWSIHARPNEACGLLTRTRLVLSFNDAERPDLCFVMNGRIRQEVCLSDDSPYQWGGLRPQDAYMLWHSHPRTWAIPSPEDVILMRQTRVPMVIVSLVPTVPQVCVYILDEEIPTRIRKVQEYRTRSLQSPGGVL